MPRLYRRALDEPIDREDHLVIVSKEIERAITFLWRYPEVAASAFGPG